MQCEMVKLSVRSRRQTRPFVGACSGYFGNALRLIQTTRVDVRSLNEPLLETRSAFCRSIFVDHLVGMAIGTSETNSVVPSVRL